MEVYQKGEAYCKTDGDFEYSHTTIVYGNGKDIYIAHTKAFRLRDHVNIDELQGVLIPHDKVYPKFDPAAFTLAPSLSSDNCYVKRTSLLDYREDADDDDTAEIMLGEARVCEALKRSPHPNLAKYLGCTQIDFRMTALCFEKYEETLCQRVRRKGSKFDQQSCMEGIRSGIEHLHSLGYCHNDLHPDNVMPGAGDTPVIIDFDSCQPMGHRLGPKLGSEGYSDDNATLSQAQNDFYSLKKIEEFLDKEGR